MQNLLRRSGKFLFLSLCFNQGKYLLDFQLEIPRCQDNVYEPKSQRTSLLNEYDICLLLCNLYSLEQPFLFQTHSSNCTVVFSFIATYYIPCILLFKNNHLSMNLVTPLVSLFNIFIQYCILLFLSQLLEYFNNTFPNHIHFLKFLEYNSLWK